MDAAVAAKLRANSARIAENNAQAAEHYLPAAAAGAFGWLVDGAGYHRPERSFFGIGTVRLIYRSEKTWIRIAVGLPRDPEFSVGLAPKGLGYAPLNDCLAAHHMSKVDLSLPHGVASDGARDFVLAKLDAASAGLRLLLPWEVGGNWFLDP